MGQGGLPGGRANSTNADVFARNPGSWCNFDNPLLQQLKKVFRDSWSLESSVETA